MAGSYYVSQIKKLQNGKYEVSLNGGEPLTLYGKELARYGVREDHELSEESYRLILTEVLNKRATKRAMHLMEQQDRTESALRDKLAQVGYPQESIDAAVEYLNRFHYLDDLRYAVNYISFHEHQYGRAVLKQKLLQKGVPSDLIGQAIEQAYDADEGDQIRALLQKKHYDPSMDYKEKQKVYAFLMRKGYSSSAIRRQMGSGMDSEME